MDSSLSELLRKKSQLITQDASEGRKGRSQICVFADTKLEHTRDFLKGQCHDCNDLAISFLTARRGTFVFNVRN